MKKNANALIALVLALAVLATACGGGSDSDSASGSNSSDDDAVIAAVAQSMVDEGDTPEGVDINCMAGAMVTGLGGADAMEENFGLTAETIANGQSPDDVELPKAQAIAMADEAMDCGLSSVIVEEMASEGMSDDDAQCLFEQLDKDAVRDMFAAEFMNATEGAAISAAAEGTIFSSMFEAITSCDIDPASLGI